MTTTTHTLTNFQPQDYELIAHLDNDPLREVLGGWAVPGAAEAWRAEMREALGERWSDVAYKCAHCGSTCVRWIVAVEHKPTGARVALGMTCAERLNFPGADALKMALLKRRAEGWALAARIAEQVKEFLDANPAIKEAVATYEVCTATLEGLERHTGPWAFASDVLRKLRQYGSMSPKQAAAFVQAVNRAVEAKAIADAGGYRFPCLVPNVAPTGRVHGSFRVLKVKEVETNWGDSLKALCLEVEQGYTVWCSIPSSDLREFKGKVTLSPSDKPTHAWGSRLSVDKPKAPADSTQTRKAMP